MVDDRCTMEIPPADYVWEPKKCPLGEACAPLAAKVKECADAAAKNFGCVDAEAFVKYNGKRVAIGAAVGAGVAVALAMLLKRK